MIVRAILCAVSFALLAACAGTPPRDEARWLPLGGGDREAFAAMQTSEIEQLALVSTNLVAVLVQLPELSPTKVTLQLSAPRSAFGNTVLRALEDAGYGVQRVAADQGRHYVAYRQRFAETDAGPVTDYELTVNGLRVHREYLHKDTGVYPSSLMTIEGSAMAPGEVVLDDGIFREQGGDDEAFVSGVSGSATAPVELEAGEFDALPDEERTGGRALLEHRRLHRTLALATLDAEANARLARHERVRRAVLIFDDGASHRLGEANKQAVRLLVRAMREGDLIVVTACTDTALGIRDGVTRRHGARVIEEFLGHGLPSESVRLAPCTRPSFRHASDTSAVPVEVVQYRTRRRGGRHG